MKKQTQVIRVAAYCRVSTDKLDQANSLESQQRYFEDYISRNPLWELYEIYVDEGITGTNTLKRESFNRMVQDGKDGKFDMIITKEVSRFARNLLDSIAYTRELREYGIRLIFMNDNIDTDQPDHEFRLAMMASLAQEESRKTSERVRWGQRRRMEQGVVFGRDMLGYDVRDGKLIINEEGAEIVRLIYHKYLDEGKGCHVIANELREAGIPTSRFMKEWSYTVILRVLKNEKYCGDLVQQKTYTQSYLSHKKKANKGELDYVIIRDHHEPIISRERFEAAQRELQRRHDLHYTKNGFANRYALSGKIICAECGATFVHSMKKCPNGTKYENWTCITKDRKGKPKVLETGEKIGCDNVNLRDADIRLILQYIIKDVMENRQKLLDSVLATVDEVLRVCADKNSVEYFEKEIIKVESKKEKLLDMCLSGDIETAEYKKAYERLNSEHRELIDKLKIEKENRDLIKDKTVVIDAITDFVNALSVGEEWDDIFYRNIIDKIYVHKDRTIDVHLKLIPEKWQAKILKGKSEIKQFEENQNFLPKGGSSVGTEELGHLEMIGAIVYQLTKNLTVQQIKEGGFEDYFVDHTTGIYPQSASGAPFTAAYIQSKGDPITDLHENLAAEQKARTTYDNILRFCDDYDVKDAIRFLREREVVHYQRFGENLRLLTDKLDEKNFYAFNPSFDKKCFNKRKPNR